MTMKSNINTRNLLLSLGSSVLLLMLFIYQLILIGFSTAEFLLYFAGATLIFSIIQLVFRRISIFFGIKYFLSIVILSYYIFVYIGLAVPTHEIKWVLHQSAFVFSFLFTILLMIFEIRSRMKKKA